MARSCYAVCFGGLRNDRAVHLVLGAVMCDMTRAPCSALRSSKAKGRNPDRFSRNAILIAITLVWLIGQARTPYVYESRINRDGHHSAVAQECASQTSPQTGPHMLLDCFT